MIIVCSVDTWIELGFLKLIMSRNFDHSDVRKGGVLESIDPEQLKSYMYFFHKKGTKQEDWKCIESKSSSDIMAKVSKMIRPSFT